MAHDEVFTARIFALIAHPVSILLLCCISKDLLCRLRTSAHQIVFRTVALVSTLSLVATSFVEVFYSAAILVNPGFRWTPRETLIGDVFVRVGVAALTSCRLYRYQLICPPERKPWVVGGLVFVLALLSASLATTTHSRLMELGHGCIDPCKEPPPNHLVIIRTWENLTSFFVFVTVQLCNMLIDYHFFRFIVDNLPARHMRNKTDLTRRTVGLAFLPSALADIAYLVSVVFTLSFNSPSLERQWRISQFLTITLLRLAPSIEAFIFFHFTMPRTRQFIRGNKHRSPSPCARPPCTTPTLGSSGSASTEEMTVALSITTNPLTGVDSGGPYQLSWATLPALPRPVASSPVTLRAPIRSSRHNHTHLDTPSTTLTGSIALQSPHWGDVSSRHSTATDIASIQTSPLVSNTRRA